MELTRKEKREIVLDLNDGDKVRFCPYKGAGIEEGIIVKWDNCIFIVQDYFQGCSIPENKKKGKKFAWVICDAIDVLYSEIYYISPAMNIKNKQYLLFEGII
jgi:hypothetical protein